MRAVLLALLVLAPAAVSANEIECSTAVTIDGRVIKNCGDRHSAPVPAGELISVTHNHPGQSSLSFNDLALLERAGSIEATTKRANYLARKGPRYAELVQVYDKVASKVSIDLVAKIRISGRPDDMKAREHLINSELARLGVIVYEVTKR